MINVKDQVYRALLAVTENVSDFYPRDWSKELNIQYMEEDNKIAEKTSRGETKSYVRYRIDIWHPTSTSQAAVAVDAALTPLGLERAMCADVEDPSGLKHKQMRYEGVVDVKNQLVYTGKGAD